MHSVHRAHVISQTFHATHGSMRTERTLPHRTILTLVPHVINQTVLTRITTATLGTLEHLVFAAAVLQVTVQIALLLVRFMAAGTSVAPGKETCLAMTRANKVIESWKETNTS